MSTAHTEKTSAPAVGAPTNQDYERFWGDRIVRTGLRGAGVGLGAGALYYLARSLSDVARQRAQAAKEKEQAALMGEKVSASAYDSVTEAIGKMLPNSPMSLLRPFTPDVPKGGHNTFDPSVTRSSFGIGATVGAGALGSLAGWKLIQALHARKKRQDRQQEVDDAERAYHEALVGKSAALDTAYDSLGEKQAAFESLKSLWDGLKRLPAAVGGAGVLAGMGSGALAAKLMYDRAKERSRAKAVEEAAKSRARVAGILPTYVDPDEIIALKQQVSNAQAG